LEGQKALNEFEKEFIGLSNYINELVKKVEANPKNDKMDFARYPFSKKGGNHFYVEKGANVDIDLENFTQLLELVSSKLESFADYIYYNRYSEEN